jgi:hypothetical protein
MYMPFTMLRALSPRDMTATERRAADEQLGKVAASLAGHRRRLAGRALVVLTTLTWAGRQPKGLTELAASRRALAGATVPGCSRSGRP